MFRRPAEQDEPPERTFVYRIDSSAFAEWWRLFDTEIVLEVEAGDVRIVWRSFGRVRRHTVQLASLADVVLDTLTTRESLNAGANGVDVEGFAAAKTVADVDRTRIVFVLADGRAIALTEDHLRYSQTNEAFGRMRLFLRRHGWLPEDER